jgi:hypothetical protein
MKKVVVENDLPKILNISATPSPTGNSVGLGQYVVDGKGSTYYIDRTGKAILIRKLTTDWVEPTLLNGWVNYSNDNEQYQQAKWRVNDGVLYIQGLVKSGERRKAIFKLPSEIHQYINKRVINATDRSGGNNARIDIYPNGVVGAMNSSSNWTSLEMVLPLDI